MKNGSSVEQSAERTAKRASPCVERLARAGYVSYGVVYALVGVLAVQAALGVGAARPQARRPRCGRSCSPL